MSTTPTTNYGWLLPVPGTEVDLWGAILNTAFQDIDTDVFTVSGVASAALPKAGGTMTGHITLPGTAPSGTQAVSLSYLNANYAELSDLAGFAPLASPALTGNPTAPTPAPGDNDTSIATTAFVTAAAAAAIVGLAPLASPALSGNPTAPTPTPGDNDTSIATSAFVTAAIAAAISGITSTPPGVVAPYAGSSAPSGWLLCDGAAVSRSTYAALFAIIGVAWGEGDGSTTFNLPNTSGRVLVGVGTGTISESQPAANFNTSDTITVDSNTQSGKPKWQTGMAVQVTTTGTLPGGIVALTTYYVRRTSSTTIQLYATFANAIDTQVSTGKVNITSTGTGTHTITHTMFPRVLADEFGSTVSADTPEHNHSFNTGTSGSGSGAGIPAYAITGSNATTIDTTGDASGITNLQPSIVFNHIIKT